MVRAGAEGAVAWTAASVPGPGRAMTSSAVGAAEGGEEENTEVHRFSRRWSLILRRALSELAGDSKAETLRGQDVMSSYI